jgi:DNA-binding transcriptional LysR family regulator
VRVINGNINLTQLKEIGMKLRSMKVFCDVVTRRSFSQAALDNQITQSATSQIINQLEKHLGVKLLDRSRRPFIVTDEGRQYFEGCHRLVQQIEELESSIRHLSDATEDTIRVASIYSVGLSTMRQFVHKFNESNPNIHVQLEYHHPQKVYELVTTGHADLGLLSYAESTKSIAAITWRAEPMVIVFSNEHPLANHHELPLQALNGLEMVGFNRDLRISQEIHRVLTDHEVHPNVVMEFDNIETLKRAIEINTGFSILPKAHIRRELTSGSLCTADILGPALIRPVGIIHRDNIPLGQEIENFIEMLIDDENIPRQYPTNQLATSAIELASPEVFNLSNRNNPLLADRQE